MNLALLLPAALAALAALVLPLLLHLARRQQTLPTVFAALRWLRPLARPRRRIRFDEPWLLLVRLLLVALLALLLARPVLHGVEDRRPRLLVVPGVAAATIAAARGPQDQTAHWLAPGFPSLDSAAPTGTLPVSSLLRDFDASLPAAAPLTVLVPRHFDGADGARLQLSRNVDWRVDASADATAPDVAITLAPPRLAIRIDPAHREGARYLRAAAVAWQPAGEVQPVEVLEAASAPAADVQVLAWLRAEALPPSLVDWVEQGGSLLLAAGSQQPWPDADQIVWRSQDGAALLRTAIQGQGRLLRFERPLEPRAMPQLLEADFPARLLAALQAVPPPVRVDAVDHQPVAGAHALPLPPRALAPWLAVAIALLALLERWLATAPRRRLPA